MVNLNDLLKSAMAEADRATAVKASREKLKDSRLLQRERDEIADSLRKWESAHEYVPTALVFRCLRFRCKGCGSEHLAGGQLLQREAHRSVAGLQRYIVAQTPYRADLPRVTDVAEVGIEVCHVCAGPVYGFEGVEE